ncbi:MAG TPA: NAD-dependent epimerase/dehydratase family protein [Methylomirabilota bacterium]|nr:NAD-dependent epimerase/dehydratase family protein [Methylomirabilota bacterium]
MVATVALTGATGFIGRTVVRRLETAGLRVRALVRPTSDAAALPAGVERVVGALDDAQSLGRLVHGARAVVHCAGAVRGSSARDFDPVNVDGVARLVRATLVQRPAPTFVHLSSLAARHPELSPYAASKRGGEQALLAAPAWTVLRPPIVYGPGDRELLPLLRWMARGIAPMVGARHGRFSLIYVDDLAEAVARLVLLEGTGHVFELDDGHPSGYAMDDVVAAAERYRGRAVVRVPVPAPVIGGLSRLNVLGARIRGRAPMLTPGKVREMLHPGWTCDNTALAGATGWRPRVRLDEGLRRTLGDAGRC